MLNTRAATPMLPAEPTTIRPRPNSTRCLPEEIARFPAHMDAYAETIALGNPIIPEWRALASRPFWTTASTTNVLVPQNGLLRSRFRS